MNKRLKKLRVIPILLLVGLVLSAFFMGSASAWTQISKTGVWTADAQDSFGQTDFWHNDYQTIEWDTTISNFSGYVLDLDTRNIQAIARGFGQTGNLRVHIALGFFVGEDCRGVIRYLFDSSQNIFGKCTTVAMGANDFVGYSTGNLLNSGTPASVHAVLNTTDTLATVEYMNVPDSAQINSVVVWADQIATNIDGAQFAHYYENFHADLYCETVTVKFFVSCAGSGSFSFSVLGEQFFTNGVQPSAIPSTNSIGGTPFVQQFLDFIGSVGSFLFSMGKMLVDVIKALLPYIGVLFFTYLLDAIVASVDEGSPQPIGKFFGWIWDMLQDVWGRIADFANAIGSWIPF